MRCVSSLVALAIVSAVAMPGCGGDRPTGSASSAPAAQSADATRAVDPCTLVTNAEATQALGAEARQDRPSEANIPPRLLTCRYTAPRGEGLAVMSVMVRTGYSDAEAKSSFQGTREVGQTEAVSGLGDDAFWLMDQLYVLKGTRSVTVAGDIERAAAEELARKALDRLP
jgi:hypothetical protein